MNNPAVPNGSGNASGDASGFTGGEPDTHSGQDNESGFEDNTGGPSNHEFFDDVCTGDGGGIANGYGEHKTRYGAIVLEYGVGDGSADGYGSEECDGEGKSTGYGN